MIAQATLKDIEADTVVAEFKTDNNKLSVWKIETDDDLKDALIALGSNCTKVGTIFAAMISPDDLEEISFDEEEGDTPTIGINQKHRNMVGLNYISLGCIITAILSCLKDGKRIVRRTRPEMKALLAKAYMDNRLKTDSLAPSLKDEISKDVMKMTSRG